MPHTDSLVTAMNTVILGAMFLAVSVAVSLFAALTLFAYLPVYGCAVVIGYVLAALDGARVS